jgi:uncharacterized protein YegJ (DUF2314 family)
LLRDEKPQQTLRDFGEQAWLNYSSDIDSKDATADQAMWRRLKEFIAAFEAKKPGQEFAVQVEIRAGFARETHWIPIRSIERGRYGGWMFTGEFSIDSRLTPVIRQGEPVAVGKHDIADWRYTAGDRTVRGRASK